MSLPQWLDESWRALAAALAHGRLHHGLLIAGAAGLGKRELAQALAAAALCTARAADGHACGHCRSCTLIAAGSHPDLVRVGLEPRDDGKVRSEIIVDQIRALSQRLALSSQFGGLQIALIDPADVMNASSANALLKTLEEPASNTVIMLVSDRPARLPATIRSRCQRIQLHVPARAQSLAWLGGHGASTAAANAALDASLGNPGLAANWLKDDTLALRADCARDLAALSKRPESVAPLAEQWAGDRPAQRLWFAGVLAEEEAARLARGERGKFGLTDVREIPKLAAWFSHANRARALLDTPVRADLLLLDLLRTWPVPNT